MSVLVNRIAPDFRATAIMPDGSINKEFQLSDYRGSYVVLFFYPMDFTFVCPSELIAHNKRIEIFEKLGVQLISVSVDNPYCHQAWRKTEIDEGGIGEVRFPMVADVNHSICRSYGVEHQDGIALRASFLIDRQGIVQAQMINNISLGRNVDEIIRLIEALQFHEEQGDVCPAGWQKGDEGIEESPDGIAKFLSKHMSNL